MNPLLSLLQDHLVEKEFKAGDSFFHQGDESEGIYFITEGRVKIARVSLDGQESVLCVRGPGNLFCPVPTLDKGEHLGTAIALTDGRLQWAPQEIVIERCAKHPDLLAYIQADCLHEVRQLLVRMENFAYRSIRERLAYTLLDIRERQIAQGESDDVLSLTQQELAGLIGASRESVSRTLSAFEHAGILKTRRGGVVILDPEKLRLISG
jgi:CRP/FNR family transcriptional regulator